MAHVFGRTIRVIYMFPLCVVWFHGIDSLIHPSKQFTHSVSRSGLFRRGKSEWKVGSECVSCTSAASSCIVTNQNLEFMSVPF
jgi:hypothetical protein